MISFRRTRAIGRKEMLHIVRDPRSLAMALALPMMMLVLSGYALSLDVDHIPTLVYDQDKTPESRALVNRFQGSHYFTIIGHAESYKPIDRRLDSGTALLAVVIPHNFGDKLLAGKTAPLQLLLDGSDSNTASIAIGYVKGLISGYNNEIRTEYQVRNGAGEIKPPLDAQLREVYNSELRSKNYIIPGLIAVILMIIASLLTSLTIAREWENGTMEELLSTPLRPAELVLGKLSAFFVLGIVDTLTAVIAGVWIFGVPLRGSGLLLFLSGSVFLFGSLCWGLLVSAVMRSQLRAYQTGLLSSFLPAFLLSGFIYSIDNMPLIPRMLTYIIPARYFVSLMRGVFVKGVGLEALWVEFLLLFVYAFLVFVLAVRKLREKIA